MVMVMLMWMEPSAMTIQDQTQLLAVARDRDKAAGICHDTNFDGSGDNTAAPCGLPDLVGRGQEADKNGDAKGGAKSDQNGLRHHRHPSNIWSNFFSRFRNILAIVHGSHSGCIFSQGR